MGDVAKRIARLPAAKRAALEQALLARGRAARRTGRIPRRAGDGPAPLSFAQRGMWFLDQWQPDSALYGVRSAFRLSGRLDVPALLRAFSAVVRRHEILRTIFVAVDGQPVQLVSPPAPVAVPVVDLRTLSSGDREAAVQALRDAEAMRPFDLGRGPLMRAGLVLTADTEQVLLLSVHHIVADGWSYGLLVRDLSACYAALRDGGRPVLPDLPLRYGDYAAWQHEQLGTDDMRAQLAWWQARIAGAPSLLNMPTDRARPAVLGYRGANLDLRVPPDVAAALRTLGRREGATLFMTLLAAFTVLLHRYTGDTDVVVGCPGAGRTDSDLENLMGCFVNTLPVRTNLGGEPTFPELLGRVVRGTVDAYAHQDVPFEWLVEELRIGRSASHTPVCQAMLVLENTPAADWRLPGISVRPLRIDHPAESFDLHLTVSDTEDGLVANLSYSTDLFDASTMSRFLDHFGTLLAGIAAAPERSIAELPVSPPAELDTILGEWAATTRSYVLDRNLRPVPVGVIGELYLADGEEGHPGPACEHLVPNPFGSGWMYRTGDLVRWGGDGTPHIVGGRDDDAATAAERAGVGPLSDPLSEVLRSMWTEVLGTDRIGPDTDFFEAGGHSLLAIQVMARVRDALDTALPVRALFEASTLRAFARRVDAARRERSGNTVPPVRPGERHGPIPLSRAQRRLWFIDQLDPTGAHHNVAEALELTGALDAAALGQAVDAMRGRHESLRTTFHHADGVLEQRVTAHEPMPTPLVDLSALDDTAAGQAADRLADAEARRPFDLGRDPMLRVMLVRVDVTKHLLLVTVHHIVTDAWSSALFFEELWELYTARSRGVPAQLPPLPVQYADYAVWEQRRLDDGALTKAATYWRSQLAGAPEALDLDGDRPLPITPVFRSSTLPFELSPDETRDLVEFSLREGVTVFVTVLTAYLVLLHRRTGASDLVVGTGAANRGSVELERVLGFFTNQVVLRTTVSGADSARELLARVREMTLNAYGYGEMPFDRLVELLRPRRYANRPPLFNVEIEYHRQTDQPPHPRGLTVSAQTRHSPTTTLDLSLHVAQTDTVVRGGLVYNADVFAARTARGMVGELRGLLAAIVAKPGATTAELASHAENEWRAAAARERAAAARARFDSARVTPVSTDPGHGRTS